MPRGRPKKEEETKVKVIIEEPEVGVKTDKLSKGEIEGFPETIKEG